MSQRSGITRIQPFEWPHYKRLRLASLADTPNAFGATLDQASGLEDADWQSRLTDLDETPLGYFIAPLEPSQVEIPKP